MKHHYLYILSGPSHGPIYIGTTRNLAQRLTQHRIGRSKIDAFRIDRLVYIERYPTIEAATERAKALRGASREWVDALITRKNPDWRDLGDAALQVVQKKAA
ncbi:GIY-YIG nuclease family protein [Fretibacter rubidus]|uniref:GIY-YIG nuclease family protein n=1 Tax=Fretibacter rubidus TaxID=570162 RepID=UPI003529ECFD